MYEIPPLKLEAGDTEWYQLESDVRDKVFIEHHEIILRIHTGDDKVRTDYKIKSLDDSSRQLRTFTPQQWRRLKKS